MEFSFSKTSNDLLSVLNEYIGRKPAYSLEEFLKTENLDKISNKNRREQVRFLLQVIMLLKDTEFCDKIGKKREAPKGKILVGAISFILFQIANEYLYTNPENSDLFKALRGLVPESMTETDSSSLIEFFKELILHGTYINGMVGNDNYLNQSYFTFLNLKPENFMVQVAEFIQKIKIKAADAAHASLVARIQTPLKPTAVGTEEKEEKNSWLSFFSGSGSKVAAPVNAPVAP